jgi:hypothetical protein
MTDIVIEVLRTILVGGVIFSLLKAQRVKEVSQISGWQHLHRLRSGFTARQ